jgi:cytochrome c peroxidase
MKKLCIITAMICLVVVLVCCSKESSIDGTNTYLDSIPKTNPDSVPDTHLDSIIRIHFKALPLTVTTPADNPQTPQKIALGKLLFFDPILSGNKDVACATCHHPSLGFGDGIDLSIGVHGQGLGTERHFILPNNIPFSKRNCITVINSAFNGIDTNGVYDPRTAFMFVDLRTRSLELQAAEPIKTMDEMLGTSIADKDALDTVLLRLKNIPEYVQLFKEAFQVTDAVTIHNLERAIASYERSIIANQSPYDKYIRGDKSALTKEQVEGMKAFVSNGCIKCHSGPMFSDYAPHITSVPDNPKRANAPGYNGTFAFRTLSLRNLAFTAPYMHSGMLSTLDDVLNFYEQAGAHNSQNKNVSNDQLDSKLQPLNKADRDAIIQFLNTLNDGSFDKSVPTSVPSGLHVGGNI